MMARERRYPGRFGLGWAAVVLLSAFPAGADEPAPVPATLEIEVLDPSADPLGNPAVELQPSAYYPDTLEADVPPVVLVHRYYYTGDRWFQGPMLPGGPSIVVCHHPKTGERCYIPVQLLPGVPIVRYTGSGIEYDYGVHGIEVRFGLLGRPKVVYRNHMPVTRAAKNAAAGAAERTAELIEKSGEACATVNRGVQSVAISGSEGVKAVAGVVVSPAVQLIQATPLGSIFCRPVEDIAQRRRDRQVRRAACHEREAEASIPTLR